MTVDSKNRPQAQDVVDAFSACTIDDLTLEHLQQIYWYACVAHRSYTMSDIQYPGGANGNIRQEMLVMPIGMSSESRDYIRSNVRAFVKLTTEPEEEELILAFRGSCDVTMLMRNVRMDSLSLDGDDVYMNAGYVEHYRRLRAAIHDHIGAVQHRIVTTVGHSLGGSCASICALDLARNIDVNVQCVTFGAPPTGNMIFCREFARHVPRSLRVVNTGDPAPLLEYVVPARKHVDRCLVLPPPTLWPRRKLDSKIVHLSGNPIKCHSIDAYLVALKHMMATARHRHQKHLPPSSALRIR